MLTKLQYKIYFLISNIKGDKSIISLLIIMHRGTTPERLEILAYTHYTTKRSWNFKKTLQLWTIHYPNRTLCSRTQFSFQTHKELWRPCNTSLSVLPLEVGPLVDNLSVFGSKSYLGSVCRVQIEGQLGTDSIHYFNHLTVGFT